MSYQEFYLRMAAVFTDPVTGQPVYSRRQTSGILRAALQGTPNAETTGRRILTSLRIRAHALTAVDQRVAECIEDGLVGHYNAQDRIFVSSLLRCEAIYHDYVSGLAGAPAPNPVPLPADFWNTVLPADRRTHIFDGHAYPNGTANGFHHTSGTGLVHAIVAIANASGVYIASVLILNALTGLHVPKTVNGGQSTMFVDAWSPGRVIGEIYHVFLNRVPLGLWNGSRRSWHALDTRGALIQGYEEQPTGATPFGRIVSAFPVY